MVITLLLRRLIIQRGAQTDSSEIYVVKAKTGTYRLAQEQQL